MTARDVSRVAAAAFVAATVGAVGGAMVVWITGKTIMEKSWRLIATQRRRD